MISIEDQMRLESTIREVEDLTTGEVVVVIAHQASSYRSVPILWALLSALIVPWPLLWATDLEASRIFILQLVAALALSAFLSWPRQRYALVPRSIKHARCLVGAGMLDGSRHEAAEREFLRRGLTRTWGKSGVLIYLALAEHYAEIIADSGIADKVGPGVWQEIIGKLTAAIKDGRIGDGLEEAVRQAGAILAEHAPPRFDDTDELPNKVILI